jgi:FkbM family methyltransferase
MRRVRGSPLSFRVARSMTRSQITGGGFLMRRLEKLGLLNIIAEYQIGDVMFGVPLSRLQWDASDLASYESKLIGTFCRAIAPLENVVVIDCGADIGTFSALVCAQVSHISKIVAFEPNSDIHEVLRANLSNLRVPAEIVSKAVSDHEGRGRLVRAKYDSTDHARFLVFGEGSLEVTTIDRTNVRDSNVAIKIDIEGGELEALQGAVETIASARECVVTIEANPNVARRTRRDPVECLKFLESLRPFRFVVAETGDRPSTSVPLLNEECVDVWNVVCWTHSQAELVSRT